MKYDVVFIEDLLVHIHLLLQLLCWLISLLSH
jgi:hypothetical protein